MGTERGMTDCFISFTSEKQKTVDSVLEEREEEGEGEICLKTTNDSMKYQVLIHMTHTKSSTQAGQMTKHIIIMWLKLKCS